MRRSIITGFIIALCCTVNLRCSDKVVGALMFALLIPLIPTLELKLYTGKIGYLSKWKDVTALLVCLAFNLVGVLLFRGLLLLADSAVLGSISMVKEAKLGIGVLQMFFKAVPCGALIFMGVEAMKRTKNPLFLVSCIFALIVSGYEHCISIFFFAPFSLQFAAALLGNSVGSVLTKLLINTDARSMLKKENKNDKNLI